MGWRGGSSFASLWFERWLVWACKCAYDCGLAIKLLHFQCHLGIDLIISQLLWISEDVDAASHYISQFNINEMDLLKKPRANKKAKNELIIGERDSLISILREIVSQKFLADSFLPPDTNKRNRKRKLTKGKSLENAKDSVYQIKITLNNLKPPIWRRFKIGGNITFYRLHKIIQVLMGWLDYHLFEFEVNGEIFGIPDEDDVYDIRDARRYKLYKLLCESDTFSYRYDFGDGWKCKLKIEKIESSDEEMKTAVCLTGKRNGPPEDIGGPYGYSDLIDAIEKGIPDDISVGMREYLLEKMQQVGDDFDPGYFNIKEINSELKKLR